MSERSNAPAEGRPLLDGLGALFVGVGLLGVGHGLQGTVLGVRATDEGFGTAVTGLIMAAYYVGFLGGTRFTVRALGRVGHIRVFAALASTASSVALIYAVFVTPVVWVAMRALTGFCLAGMYVVFESWLNDQASNTNRGRVMSAYLMVTMAAVALSQILFAFVPVDGAELFIASSVLWSMSLVPMALSGSSQPDIIVPEPLSTAELWRLVPTGVVVIFLTGSLVGALRGLGAVFATTVGLTSGQIALFVGATTLGGSLLQAPLGWASDRFPRRVVMAAAALVGAAVSFGLATTDLAASGLIIGVFFLGGLAMPLYSLAIAYSNDWLSDDRRVSAAAQLILINGIGAIGGPFLAGLAMRVDPAAGLFGFLASIQIMIGLFLVFRMLTVRAPEQSSWQWLTNRGGGQAVLRLIRSDDDR